MKTIKARKIRRGTKRTFLKKGTCSQTFFHILNKEFGSQHPEEEQAADPLAGGIFQQGYQCGMLWGSALAVGTESYRRFNDLGKAIGVSVATTKHIMDSFTERTRTIECEEITKTDWSSKFSIAKYLITGRAFSCFNLASRWAPEAIQAAMEGLSDDQADQPVHPVSCASEVARKMGASEAEMAMVAGFAGGLGLSGNGCGALAAAMWYQTLGRVRNRIYKYNMSDPELEKLVNTFFEATDYEMECCKITGKKFTSIKEHTEFVTNGGCSKLIEVLAGL